MHMCTRITHTKTHTQPEIRVVLPLIVRCGDSDSAWFQQAELSSGNAAAAAAAAAVRVADWSTNNGCYREEQKQTPNGLRWILAHEGAISFVLTN